MISGILGKKLAQSRRFNQHGVSIPVTLVEAGPCTVVQVKRREKDGYSAVQLGFGVKKVNNVSKAILGHLKKAGFYNRPPRFLREIPLSLLGANKEIEPVKPGQVLSVADVFKVGDTVLVTGISKGKGFAGVVKRYGFAGGPRSHGQSDRERAPGSIGQTTTPGRVYKGKRMAGRMGGGRKTVKNLQVVEIDKAQNILVLKGLVPGGRNSLLTILRG